MNDPIPDALTAIAARSSHPTPGGSATRRRLSPGGLPTGSGPARTARPASSRRGGAAAVVALIVGLWAVLLGPTAVAADASVFDEAEVIAQSRTGILETRIAGLEERFKQDIVVLTVERLDGKTAEAYADDYFDDHDMGFGPGNDGVLLLVATVDREVAISTSGTSIETFTDYGLNQLLDDLTPLLSDENWSGAATLFVEECETYMQAWADGEPIDVPADPAWKIWARTAMGGVGALLGAVATGHHIRSGMEKKMRNEDFEAAASMYIVPDSLAIASGAEVLVDVQTTSSERSTSSSGSSSGGSTTHTSSSGATHGGASRSF